MTLSSPLSIEIGVITAFSGAIGNIPPGWFLCDGTNGTPDLRDKFIVSAGPIFSVDDKSETKKHDHDFTGDGHTHTVTPTDPTIAVPVGFDPPSSSDPATGTTGFFAQAPPYYALAYIMFGG